MSSGSIVIISPHPVTGKMSGPAIRYWEFAGNLSQSHSVKLAAPNSHDLPCKAPFEIVSYNSKTLRKLVEKSSIALIQGYLLAEYPFLQDIEACLVVDLYDPYPLEELAFLPPSKLGEELYRSSLASLLLQILRGDFFLCASERQREYWLGVLTAMGRVNPSTYQSDVTFQKLIGVVPFGLPSQRPVKSRQVLKGIIPNIRETDKVVLWGGGIYDWLDPLTAIGAMKEILPVRDDVKLYFMGLAHPTQGKVSTQQISRAIELARELGLLDRQVFFNTEWVSYDERQNYLLEADIGISTHPEHIEAHFSFRTRILDYIWAGLPVVATSGDSLSDLIIRNELGRTTDPGDAKQVSQAILSILSIPDYRKVFQDRSAQVRPSLTWENAVKPLADYCSRPQRAVDREFMKGSALLRNALSRTLMRTKSLIRTSWLSLREEGLDTFVARAQAYLKRRANK